MPKLYISFANFEGSIGAKLDPQKAFHKNLSGTNLTDVEIIGSFADAYIPRTTIDGCIVSEYLLNNSDCTEQYRTTIKEINRVLK